MSTPDPFDIVPGTAEWCIAYIFKREGGYVNDPDDAGGETKYGISKRSYPDVDIAGLTKDGAGQIYRRDFWERAYCGLMPAPLALLVLDAAVMSGPERAVKWLQVELGVKPATGNVGPITLDALEEVATTGKLAALCNAYTEHRLRYYRSCRTYAKHGRGWDKRTRMTLNKALALLPSALK
jgi:lysozyme family protein